MVVLIEGGLAEEPRPSLGRASGEGHRLQHCIKTTTTTAKTRQHRGQEQHVYRVTAQVSTHPSSKALLADAQHTF